MIFIIKNIKGALATKIFVKKMRLKLEERLVI